jgi:hypothetical protein
VLNQGVSGSIREYRESISKLIKDGGIRHDHWGSGTLESWNTGQLETWNTGNMEKPQPETEDTYSPPCYIIYPKESK